MVGWAFKCRIHCVWLMMSILFTFHTGGGDVSVSRNGNHALWAGKGEIYYPYLGYLWFRCERIPTLRLSRYRMECCIWRRPSGADHSACCGAKEPCSTWSESRHCLERWAGNSAIRRIHFFFAFSSVFRRSFDNDSYMEFSKLIQDRVVGTTYEQANVSPSFLFLLLKTGVEVSDFSSPLVNETFPDDCTKNEP